MSAFTRTTVATLMHAHIEQASAETPRPLPYRTRRRRAGMWRLWIAVAAIAGFALPLIGSY